MPDKRSFVMWSADKFQYPLTEAPLYHYKEKYAQDENAWLMTTLDEQGKPVGHFLMRLADIEGGSIHLGFIDDRYEENIFIWQKEAWGLYERSVEKGKEVMSFE